MHGFYEVFVFEFSGCAIVEFEKVGWIDQWGGAVVSEERETFHSHLLGFPVTYEGYTGVRGEGFGSRVAFVVVNTQDHRAIVFDVAGGLGGGVKGFIERIGGGVVV